MEVGQSFVDKSWNCYARPLFLGLCLMQAACYAYASQDLTESKSMAENGDTSAQTLFHSRESAEAQAKAKAAEYAKARMVEDAKAKAAEEAKAIAQLKTLENANNLKYSGGLSEALQNNKDKGLDWFKNKLFKLDKASVITMCDPGICYVVAFSGLSGLGITSENGDFNGRQLQGQLVRVIGTDRFGNIVVTRLTTNDKPSQNSRPAKHVEEVRQVPIAIDKPERQPIDKPERQPIDETLRQLLAEPERQQASDDGGEEVTGTFEDLILARASEGWARPPSAKKGMKVVLQINMLPDGTMKSVSVARSSGDTPYDNSAVAAVKNVGRLPEMQGLRPSDFQQYSSFRMTVTPDDLAL